VSLSARVLFFLQNTSDYARKRQDWEVTISILPRSPLATVIARGDHNGLSRFLPLLLGMVLHSTGVRQQAKSNAHEESLFKVLKAITYAWILQEKTLRNIRLMGIGCGQLIQLGSFSSPGQVSAGADS
jgi:hypothetical protein